jgi:hypothetical protein
MLPMRPVLAALALSALSACAATEPAAPQTGTPAGPALPAPGADTCGATARAGLIGQPATALERVYILGPVRLIRPNDAITKDELAGRINFGLDAFDRIVTISCG